MRQSLPPRSLPECRDVLLGVYEHQIFYGPTVDHRSADVLSRLRVPPTPEEEEPERGHI